MCRAPGPVAFAEVDGRVYRACHTCQARFLDAAQRPSPEAELARYREHENDIDDPRYRAFLSRLADALLGRLAPGLGWLGLMTCFQTDDDLFAAGHYRQDPTHVVFYREATMHAIAEMRGWTCEIPAKDIALMRKA